MAHPDRSQAASPIILALENSSLCGSVALVTPGLCLAEYSLTSSTTHSRRLLAAIQQILTDAAVSWEEISAIAVSAGPGSFTGLRIGMTTAKGLAIAAAKPLISVSSLSTLACQLPFTDKLICPVLDARKQEVYTAFFRTDEDGIPRRVSDICAIPPQELAQLIAEDVIFVGDGATLYRQVLTEGVKGRASFADPAFFFIRAAALGGLALGKWQNGEFLDVASAIPDYIRPSEAELGLK